jgi:4-hydroxy-2-oxoheptanedioate aldolase
LKGSVPKSESDDPVVIKAVEHIRMRALAHGKIAGIFCSSGEAAAMRIKQGFQMVTPGNEAALMASAAKAAVATARGAQPTGVSKTGY